MKAQLLNILRQHQGRLNPITGKELARLLSQNDDRKIRMLIEELIEEGHAIVGATQSPMGYFIAVTVQEVKECTESLKSRGIQIFMRRQKLLKNASQIKPLVQGRLI
jgi:hypothetical protein